MRRIFEKKKREREAEEKKEARWVGVVVDGVKEGEDVRKGAKSCEREKKKTKEERERKPQVLERDLAEKMGRKGENEMGWKKKMQEREEIAREREVARLRE